MNNWLPSIIITGASGFIGRHFLNELKDQFLIFAIARRSRTAAGIPYHKNVMWIQWDIGNEALMPEVLKYIQKHGGAEYVLHLAGYYDFDYSNHPEYQRTNVDGTKNILEIARQLNVKRVIFSSSLAACNFPAKGECVTEKSHLDADFAYARSKKAGEEMMFQYSKYFACSIVRLAAVFSDWCEYAPLYKFVTNWLSRSWSRKILGGKGESAITYVHIQDLTKLVCEIINRSNSLPAFDIYIASPNGSVSHRELFEHATRDYFGMAVAPLLLPKIIAGIGIVGRNLMSMLRVIPRPFERPWMVKYIDRKLVVDATYTQKMLSWVPVPRYHILRRLLFLLINMKSHPTEWRTKNEAALQKVAYRPGFLIYKEMVSEKEKLQIQIRNHIMDPSRSGLFRNYQKMEANELEFYISSLYHLLLASVRSGDRSLIIKYMDDIALLRFASGFEVEEICNALIVFNEIIIKELRKRPGLRKFKQEIQDCIGLTVQLAQDVVEDTYDNLEKRLTPAKLAQLKDLKDQKSRQEMLRKLSAFYQNHPSG
ncbi:MAG: NAD-dependent epimerase/dehydratase family protein [Marinifilaceae bacterium]